jgi:acetoin utilization deacetylase AcuC-like enzyme
VAEACRAAEEAGEIVALDSDTRVSAASWEAALGSLGTSIEAARAIVAGELSNAFVATRPPGHHATPTTPMGFCLFNNVALTARWLQREGHAERVLVVDWDVHHGNGTQDAFYDDPTVFFLSLHQWPHYPGTGAAQERGAGVGRGATLNVPLREGTPRTEYLDRFDAALTGALAWGRPDFVLVSSGFDAMAGDPLGGLLLEPDDFWTLTRRVVDLADDSCGGRVLALLEGGYDPPRLGLGVVAVLRGLAGLEAP